MIAFLKHFIYYSVDDFCSNVGYFVLHHKDMGGLQTFFAQLWKEYALSDSRYLTHDPFVLCVEAITVVCLSCFSLLDTTLLFHTSRRYRLATLSRCMTC